MAFFTPSLFAHSPDLTSLIIYEQNGKGLIALKSSLAAFEGEIIYHFGKDAYKTPQEFKDLAIKYFKKSCFIVVNNNTIKFKNLQLQLGYETTFFEELVHVPQKIMSYYLKNTFLRTCPIINVN